MGNEITNNWINKTMNNWEKFITDQCSEHNILNDINDLWFDLCITVIDLEGDDINFIGRELQIVVYDNSEGEDNRCELGTLLTEIIFTEDSDNNFEPYILLNEPDYHSTGSCHSISYLGEGTIDEVVKILKKINTIDYNLFSESNKEDFGSFNSSKMKSKS